MQKQRKQRRLPFFESSCLRGRILPWMFLRRSLWSLCLCGAIAVPARGQFATKLYTLTPEERTELEQGRDKLSEAIKDLRDRVKTAAVPKEWLPDVLIYWEAVDRNLRQGLFFNKASVDQARACVKEGLARALSITNGSAPWLRQKGIIVLGYISAVDGSAQPYQVYLPADLDRSKQYPLETFLHGRGDTLNELTFINGTGWMRSAFGATTPDHPVLYPYGRGNNGWRWAGEQDVFEAMGDLQRRNLIRPDIDRLWLRGFSMGGHGAWHLGLQHPDLWAAVSPGAGFVDTVNYQSLKAPLPPHREELLHLYDPISYAANATGQNLIPYVGDTDTFASQHKLIGEAFQKEGVQVDQIIGSKTGHSYEKEALKEVLARVSSSRFTPSTNVRYVTYTLRWPTRGWVRIDGLEEHWKRAEVNATRDAASKRIEIHTTNISSITLTAITETEVVIDGTHIKIVVPQGSGVELVKRGGKWGIGKLSGLRKTHGLTGPIDDALFGSVLAVKPTGTAWQPNLGRWADMEQTRFRTLWDMYLRATLPEMTDAAITKEQIAQNNLYLFGDPGSNAVLRRILPKLPIKWTEDSIEVAGKVYSTKDHLPMFIFPNPENLSKYVVINSGFTFSQADIQGSNARQHPHLPDWAVIRYDADHFADERDKDTVASGFFDERWKFKKD
jgi:pimeloyl-ACP methyl ester carboxylesterase